MSHNYEVVILGSGISGSILGAILARNNVRVAIIDSGTHPRFAVGEATVPETTIHLKIMSLMYGVPEIADFANFFDLRDRIGSSHGIKRGFSFCYHRDKQAHRPEETTQTATLSPPFGPDSHWFRQDTDQHALAIAAHYGADVFQSTTVTEMRVRDDGVEILTEGGIFLAEFCVDASGPFSPFAKTMGIRDNPTVLNTKSRGIFTHMVGVDQYENVVGRNQHRMPYRVDQTTLHHIFPEGWMWVIPFNNHSQATNTLCSVGVMFHSDKQPKPDCSAEEEFETFLARFPSIAKQFQSAKAVRKWVSSSRIQYSSSRVWQDRYFALPHAAAFIDPLFSTGLNLTFHAINLLGDALIESFNAGVLRTDLIQTLERQILRKVTIYDRLVAVSFMSFRSFAVWNAWYRVWEIGTYFNTLGAMKSILNYGRDRDRSVLKERFNSIYAAPLAFGVEGYATLFDTMANEVERIDRGEISEEAGVKTLYSALEKFDAMPSFITRREESIRTIGTFTSWRLIRMFLWGKFRGPIHARHYYGFSLQSFCVMAIRALSQYRTRHRATLLQPLVDMLREKSSNTSLARPGETRSETVRSLTLPKIGPEYVAGTNAATDAGPRSVDEVITARSEAV